MHNNAFSTYVVTECGHVEAELTNIIGMLSGNGIWKLRGQTAKWIPPKKNRYVPVTQAHLIHVNASKTFVDLEIDEVTIDVSLGVQIGDF